MAVIFMFGVGRFFGIAPTCILKNYRNKDIICIDKLDLRWLYGNRV